MAIGKRYILKRPFDGVPKRDDFELIEENLPTLKDGEILIEALFLSVDPYMGMYVLGMKPPFTMIGVGVYKIRESRDSNYPKGETVIANAGWVQTGLSFHIFFNVIQNSSFLLPSDLIKNNYSQYQLKASYKNYVDKMR